MSTAEPPVSAPGSGLGYGIAIAVSILVLISTIMLASYACIRVKGNGIGRNGRTRSSSNDGNNSTIGNDQELATNNWSAAVTVVVGLDKASINAYPTLVLGESRRLPKPNEGPCSICLSDYQAKDCIRCIPDCHHCFHTDCIDEWLKVNASCPMCRNSPAPSKAPTPATSPLSELVPLAFHGR